MPGLSPPLSLSLSLSVCLPPVSLSASQHTQHTQHTRLTRTCSAVEPCSSRMVVSGAASVPMPSSSLRLMLLLSVALDSTLCCVCCGSGSVWQHDESNRMG